LFLAASMAEQNKKSEQVLANTKSRKFTQRVNNDGTDVEDSRA
jgi:hypothetical protein